RRRAEIAGVTQQATGASAALLNVRGLQGRLGIAERRGLAAAAAYGPDVEYPAGYGTPEFNAAERRAAAGAGLAQEQQRLQILQQTYGLSQAETAQMTLRVIEAEKLVKIHQADGDQIKEGLAMLEAQVKAAAVLRAEFERTNALGGLAKGFADMADQAESAGTIM